MSPRKYLHKFCTIAAFMLTAAVFHEAPTVKAEELLRLALLPIPDVLPVYVAMEKGYFSEAGIEVEALPVGSAIERDQLMQAGRVDGMINEVFGAALFNRDSQKMMIVSYARKPMQGSPLFRVLAAPDSEVKEVADLAGVEIGVSKNTVIEYVTDRLLEKSGVAAGDIATRSVPVVPERFQLLLEGQIKAATLPDPLGFAAIQSGAVEVINDLAVADLSASVVSFSQAAVTEKAQAVQSFMTAWDRAAADINSDPEGQRELLLKHIRVPGNVRDSFPIPPLPRGQVPSREQWDDGIKWLIAGKLLTRPVAYEQSVTDQFLVK